MFWIAATALIGIAAYFAAQPFLRQAQPQGGGDTRTNVYRKHLAEIESDAEQGFIAASEADALRIEAQRRLLLEADKKPEKEAAMPLSQSTTALVVAGMVIAGGVGLYATKGQPMLRSAQSVRHPVVAAAETARAPSSTGQAAASQVGSVDSMVGQLAARLEQQPEDADGWRMLGWSYFNLQRFKESADAYAHAVVLVPDNANYQAAFGESLVRAAGGFVTEDALAAFDKTVELQADNARARFFKGLALDQAGDADGALSAWIEMVNTAPTGADWVSDLRKRIVERAKEVGVDVSGRLTDERPVQSTARGPTVADIQAAMEMPATDRNDMVEGMVSRLAARLKENPNDPEGWIRLIRSKTVLGRTREAQDDLETALNAFADAPETRARIIAEASALGVTVQ